MDSIVRIDGNAKGFAPWLILMPLLLVACTRTPGYSPPPASAPTPPPVTIAGNAIDEALPALVLAERMAAREHDLATLGQLWAEDARIVDSRGAGDPADVYIWQGRDAILDRYVLAVFPAPPPPLTEPLDLVVTRTGDTAAATLGNDRWRFTFAEGRWWLQELMY
ncbi:MAG: hypothetical protein R6W76_12825 [Caldilinea sp.]